MNEFIEAAEKKAGKKAELAKILKISDGYIRMVKTGRRGFSDDVCIRLADYIGANRLEVIAASNLVTEKDEEKRKIFESCFTTAASVIFLTVTVGNTDLLSLDTNTSDFFYSYIFCIMLNNNRRNKLRRKSDKL